MIQQEIQQRSEQIALMLGWEQYQDYEERWFGHWKPNTTLEKPWSIRVERLEFHSDWNWLMEAVEFIEIKGYEIGIFANRVEIITTIEENRVYETGGKTKKEAVFIAVSDFARQFNLYKL